MRISKMTLQEYGPFKDASFEFPAKTEPESAEIHIFTGPNGCGKSSALYALAALFGGPEPALDRIWGSGKALISFCVEDGHVQQEIKLNAKTLTPNAVSPVIGKVGHFENSNSHRVKRRFLPKIVFQIMNQPLYAYAGKRSNDFAPLKSILYPQDQQQHSKLFFNNPTRSDDLVQWIANNMASEAIEINRNHHAALRHKKALAKLKLALSSCIDKEVSFELSTSLLKFFILIDGIRLDLNVLPDGLKSILGWLGDILMRLDQLNTDPKLDSLSQSFTLLLDEIDIHLHPSWQRRLLPMIQKLFPNAQIFCSTHSPFVVNSVDGAWVHAIELDGPYATPQKPVRTQEGQSYAAVLRQIFDTPQRFGPDVEQKLAEFYQLRAEVLKGDSGKMKVFEDLANALAKISTEVSNIVLPELRQLSNAIRREAAS